MIALQYFLYSAVIPLTAMCKYFCGICDKVIRNNSKAIFCNFCEYWIHPRCNLLSSADFDSLANSDEDWSCLKCNSEILPFGSDHLSEENFFSNIDPLLDPPLDSSSKDEDDELPVNINCKYYSFNTLGTELSKSLKSKADLSFFHLNCNSLSKHFDEISISLDQFDHKFSVLGFSETRSTSSIPDIENYSHIHNPASGNAGGTALYILSSLTFIPRHDLSSILFYPKNLESTFIEIQRAKQSNVVVGCLYKHPLMNVKDFINLYLNPFLDKISKEHKSIVLMGDFNINLLNHNVDPNVNEFLDSLHSHHILPFINLPTRLTPTSKTLIDNIFMTHTLNKSISGNITSSISDHLPQFLITFDNVNSNDHEANNNFYRDWNNFNIEGFKKDFTDIDWDLLFLPVDNVNNSFNLFFEHLNNLVNIHAPLKKLSRRQIKNSLKPWITAGIRKSISLRNFYFKKFVNSTNKPLNKHYHNLYKFYRNRIVNLIRNSKKNYYNLYFQNNINNTKKIWEGINEILNNRAKKINTQKISLKINEKITSDPKLISSSFNDYFSSVADNVRNNIKHSSKNFEIFLKNRNPNSFFFSPIMPDEISKIITSLNINKASGPNSIHHIILNTLNNEISTLLANLFNASLANGEFPSILKSVTVIPVFKNKGSPLTASNYRPITLLSNIDKIFEKIVYKRLLAFLDTNNILNNRQFGFRSKHSTIHALISLTENIRKNLDEGKFSCGIFIDLQKAFDTVDHEILLSKLNHYGIRGIANSWFKSYLTNRYQSVSISNILSSFIKIKYGVPQGSVLGPLLFLIYINDLSNSILFSDVFHFADDTNLLYSSSSLKSIKKHINIDLKHLLHWLNANKISLNATKTEVVLFRHRNKQLDYDVRLKLNGNKLYFTNSVRYLGVILDPHLSWKTHLDNLALKLRKSNGALSILRHFLPRSTLLNTYHALFGSHSNYACQVWGQALPLNHRIIKLQKTALRLITFSPFRHSSKPLLYSLKILNISDYINLSNLILVHQILNLLTPVDIRSLFDLNFLQTAHNTRGSSTRLLARPLVRTSLFGINSVLYQCIISWNNMQLLLPHHDLSSLSLGKLKSFSKLTLLSHYCS